MQFLSRLCYRQVKLRLKYSHQYHEQILIKSVNISYSAEESYIHSIMAANRYCIDLAKRGTAGCKECKKKIDKGIVRIAKILPNPFTESGGDMKQWFHSKCIFDKLSRAKAATKKIESIDDLEGWDELDDEHKPQIEKYISEFSSLLTKKTPQKKTPQKKKQAESDEEKTSVQDEEDEDSPPTKDDTLRQFRKICAEIAEVPEYKRKTAILSKFFSKGSDGSGFDGNLYLWVKMLLPMVEKRVYNLQNKQLIKLFSEIFECSTDDMMEHLETGEVAGDVAVTISTFFEESDSRPPAKKSILYLQDVDKYLQRLSKVSRETDQSVVLTEIAKKCTSNDLKMFIRFIKHDLRITAGPKPVLEAIHSSAYEAFQASRNLKDIISRSKKQNPKTGSQQDIEVQSSLMTPVLPMLAMACKSYESVFQRCKKGFYVEIKYDGERLQLHKRGNEFSYFSRSLKPVMPYKIAHLKDYIPKAFPHGNNLMLDCEILLVDNKGKPLPFGTLGAHKKSEFQDATVCLYVFDCLQFNNENLMRKPLDERRKILKENMAPIKNHIVFSEMKEIGDMTELKGIIRSVFKQGLEGVVIKAKDGIYEPGKRHWLKVKKDYLKEDNMADTADLVVLGAFYGSGKFGGTMSIFLMGCYNDRSKQWCTVTKVHNGLTDDDVKRLQEDLKMKKISRDRSKVPAWLNVHDTLVPDFIAEDPKESPVWEITGAEFTKTNHHTAKGISIRFPRITRERDDKSWKEATTLQELETLHKISKQTSDLIGLNEYKNEDEEDEEENDKPDDEDITDISDDDRNSENSSKRSPDSKSESPAKKLKKEHTATPPKQLPKKKATASQEGNQSEKTKNTFDDSAPTKKLKPNADGIKGDKTSTNTKRAAKNRKKK